MIEILAILALSDGVWAMVTGIAVAITSGPAMWYLKRFDTRNTEQHLDNKATFQREIGGLVTAVEYIGQGVERVEGSVDRVEGRLNQHIDHHLLSATPPNSMPQQVHVDAVVSAGER